MSENIATNVDLLEAPQEAFQALIYENNRAILLALNKSEGKTIEELQEYAREKFAIHEIYIGKSQLEALEKIGLIRHKNSFKIEEKSLKAKYVLAPAGLIAVECIEKIIHRYKPLDIEEAYQIA